MLSRHGLQMKAAKSFHRKHSDCGLLSLASSARNVAAWSDGADWRFELDGAGFRYFSLFCSLAAFSSLAAKTCSPSADTHAYSGSIPEIKAEESSARITSDSGTFLLLTAIFALVCPTCLGCSHASAQHCRLMRRGLHAGPPKVGPAALALSHFDHPPMLPSMSGGRSFTSFSLNSTTSSAVIWNPSDS